MEGIEKALKIRADLFDIANSYAGEETGHAAVWLHEACNCILRADEFLTAKKKLKEIEKG